MNYKQIVGNQLAKCNQSEFEYIRDTGWLDDVSDNQIGNLHEEYIKEAQNLIGEIAKLQGEPVYTSSSSKYFADWFPEALYAAGWVCGEKLLFVAAEHHDREAPVALLVGALELSKIEELKA